MEGKREAMNFIARWYALFILAGAVTSVVGLPFAIIYGAPIGPLISLPLMMIGLAGWLAAKKNPRRSEG